MAGIWMRDEAPEIDPDEFGPEEFGPEEFGPEEFATEEIGDEVVDRMVEEIVASDASATAVRLFVDRGRPGPLVRWRPQPADLPHDGHRFLLAQWQQACGGRTMPPVSAIDPFTLRAVLGALLILDVLDGGADFRFRLYGTAVAEAMRFDWTGRTVDETRRALKGPGQAFYKAVYRALLRRPEPVYTVNAAMIVFRNRAWGRLLLPYGDAATGTVQRILVGNYVLGDEELSDEEERDLDALRQAMRAGRGAGPGGAGGR